MPSAEETQFQITAFNYVRKARPNAAVWSVDNGVENDGSRRAENILMKRRRRGILAGVADLHMLDGGTFIQFELKRRKGGRVSDAQIARKEEIERNGGHWFGPITRIEEIEAALISLGKPVSCHTGGRPVPIPKIGSRRMANYRKLDDPVPEMGHDDA